MASAPRFRPRANAGTIKGMNRQLAVAPIHPHTASMIAQASRVQRLANINVASRAIGAGSASAKKGRR